MKSHRRLRPWAWAVALVAMAGIVVSCEKRDLTGGPDLLSMNHPEVGPIDPCPPPDTNEFPIIINELMLQNESVLMDENGNIPPAWVELYNPTAEEIFLGGAYLSDDLSAPEKWEIPCVDEAVIAPGGFFLIYLDGDVDDAEDFHANFVPPTIGPIFFIVNNGSDLVEIDAAEELGPDVSAGRFPEGAEFFRELLTATPGSENDAYVVPPDDVFVRGDVDENGIVNGRDLGLLIEVVLEMGALPLCEDRADVNDDGLLDIGDIEFLVLHLEPGGPSIPLPWPTEGMDFTPDALPCIVPIAPPGDDGSQ